MQYQKMIRELFSGMLAITHEELFALRPFYEKYLRGEVIEEQPAKIQLFSQNGMLSENETQSQEQDYIMVLPIEGTMTRSGGCFSMGCMEMGDMLNNAWQDDSIKAVVFRNHSGGGSIHSMAPITNALKNANKPVIAAVDTISGSANYYISAYADEIIATHEMAQVGSIGVMAQIMNDDKLAEEEGIKIQIIRPPESNWKNEAFLQARDGKPELLIKEELTPWAKHFQKIVMENRPKLNTKVEGILNGREFYAYDAIENGLIDSIMPFDKVIERAYALAQRNQISNLI